MLEKRNNEGKTHRDSSCGVHEEHGKVWRGLGGLVGVHWHGFTLLVCEFCMQILHAKKRLEE